MSLDNFFSIPYDHCLIRVDVMSIADRNDVGRPVCLSKCADPEDRSLISTESFHKGFAQAFSILRDLLPTWGLSSAYRMRACKIQSDGTKEYCVLFACSPGGMPVTWKTPIEEGF